MVALVLYSAGCAGTSPRPFRASLLAGSDNSQCVAFPIEPGLYATAAHCITSKSFLINGTPAKPIAVGAFSGDFLNDDEKTGQDVALLRSNRRIEGWAPGFLDEPLIPGQDLVILLPGDRRIGCTYRSQSFYSLFIECDVVEGWSGAPVILMTKKGPRLVGLVSGHGVGREKSLAVVSKTDTLKFLLKTI